MWEDRGGTPVTIAEYRSNGLNQRIGEHQDANADAAVNSSDPCYWFVYDDRWRIVNAYRVASGGTVDTFARHCQAGSLILMSNRTSPVDQCR